MEIKLVKTCYACPEQYDAFLGKKQVGYLRLRHGHFSVQCPDVNGQVIYSATTKCDGIFEEGEREFYLEKAREAIKNYIIQGQQ